MSIKNVLEECIKQKTLLVNKIQTNKSVASCWLNNDGRALFSFFTKEVDKATNWSCKIHNSDPHGQSGKIEAELRVFQTIESWDGKIISTDIISILFSHLNDKKDEFDIIISNDKTSLPTKKYSPVNIDLNLLESFLKEGYEELYLKSLR